MNKKKIYLITGFLGSGKTTFLNYLLTNNNNKNGILINEFGKISIDSNLIRNKTTNLIELTNGSIFCACLKDTFICQLENLLKKDLEYIFIEGSGLADPSDMLKVVDLLEKKEYKFDFMGNICLIDGVLFEKSVEVIEAIRRQVKHSHILAINKVDLIDDRQVARIEKIIRKINGTSKIIHMIKGIPLEAVDFDSLLMNKEVIEGEPTSNKKSNRPKIAIVDLNNVKSKNDFLEFLEEIKADFYRIKGYLEIRKELYKVDTVEEIVQVEKFNNRDLENKGKLVFISAKGNKGIANLTSALNKYFTDDFKIQIS